MNAFEELQRRQDQAIAFYKNRLDLTLAHQKEITTLFFKVTIGYFAVLYGVFLIYEILYDTHFKDVDFFLYLIIFLFSATFLSWAYRSLVVLNSLDSRIYIDQGDLDQELYRSHQHSPETRGVNLETAFLKLVLNENLRKTYFQHNSQALFLSLIILILVVPFVLCIYTIVKMPLNVLFECNLWNLKIALNWQWICTIYSLGLLAINIYIDHEDIKERKQIQEFEDKRKFINDNS